MDPCIKCTRSKLDTGQGVLGLVAPEDLLSVCCLVLPLVLSSVVLSPHVSSCLGFSALVSSCVVCWASPTHFGPPEGHFEAPGGSWGSKALLGLSRAAPGQPLGRSLGTLGAPWGHSWRLLGLSWPALGLLPASLGPSWRSWASFGASWAALGRRKRFSRNLVKNVVFAWFLRGFGPSGPLLAALVWLLGRLKSVSYTHLTLPTMS